MSKDLLRKYNKKRDFRLTKEPSGKKKVSKMKQKKLIFVVQEHHASRLHYDFRLELEGVLKSWALPKGPSLDPAHKRLAVQTEDHPLLYAKFHGTIPEGEYGGGEVFIWDKGTWEPEGNDPIEDLKKGHLKFWLKGKKLNGSFVLVRTHFKGSESQKSWLLIKHHDEADVPDYQINPISTISRKKSSKKVAKKNHFHVPTENGSWVHEIKSPDAKTIHWVKPTKICEVSFGNWSHHGNKRLQEIHMEKANKKRSILKEISSPDKILFKKEKKTKQDVLNFYQMMAKAMLPYLKNRPLSVVRCPNGSEGTCFFQKHFTGSIPESFHTFPIKEDKGEGIYLSIDSAEGLQELVQLNAFEIHAWNCNKDDYMRPDQIVMDLDPGPEVPWSQVIEAAFELKELLEDLDLKSFVKLTGGKGIHVHVPIAPLYEWDQIKSFTQTLAKEMEARNPSRYVANMSKKLRENKIFVDYLRNAYGATAVVPYSLRAKPLSAIALPLEWSELKRVKNPQEFTMDKALRKIKSRKKDPWDGMLKMKQKINVLTPVKKAKAA